MGFLGNIADRIRAWARIDKEQAGLQFAKGSTASGYPSTGSDLMQAYGYDTLSDSMKLEHDLISRYIDFEEMGQFPEIACLSGETRIGTLGGGEHGIEYITISELIAKREADPEAVFYTLAVDIANKKVVPTEFKGPVLSGTNQPVFKVTFREYHGAPGKEPRIWSIRATANHPFMLRDGSYRTVAELKSGDRLMPVLTTLSSQGYPVLCDVFETRFGKSIKLSLHRLVAQTFRSDSIGADEVVHHIDGNKLNSHPANLRIMSAAAHTGEHARNSTPETRKKLKRHASKRWGNKKTAVSWAASQLREGDRADFAHLKSNFQAQGLLSDSHRAAIAAGRTIPLAKDVVENSLRTSVSISEAARKLGVSWNTLSRRMVQFDFPNEIIGSSLQGIQEGEPGYGNHIVLSIEPDGFADVYDIEVPKYKNFVAEGVFVHNTALEIYADDSTQPTGPDRHVAWTTSPDKTLEEISSDLFHRTLRLDEEAWSIARTACSYGNDFEELLVDENGVRGLNFLAPPTVRRIEGQRGELYGYVQDFRGRFGFTPAEYQQILAARNAMRSGFPNQTGTIAGMERVTALEDWEVVHFRIQGKHRRSVYGDSILEPSRFIWKRLMLLEDSAMVYRLTRAPERYAFYVDIGDLPPQEALAYLNRVRQQHKKQRFLDPSTGKLQLKNLPLNSMDDFFVPVRQGAEGTRIEVLGSPSWQCLTAETRIPLRDGSAPTIKELAARGGEFEVHSANERGEIVVGHGFAARQTRPSAEIFEVSLSNGETVRCTGNHPFMTEAGMWVLAENLPAEMPLKSIGQRVLVSGVRSTGKQEPVYCLTVREHHNFAIAQGVIVKNSMEDLQYFRDKLFAGLRIPKAYLAQLDGVNRGTLSSEDVRFCRGVLRIQNSLRSGFAKILRVHFAALNIDPNAVPVDIHMTVPSAIFELAQLEVKNARADLSARMQPFFSEYYMLSKIWNLNDDEITTIMQQRDEDSERLANQQANAQSIITRTAAQAGIQGQTAGQIDATQMMTAAGMAQPPEGAQGPPAQQPAPAAPAKRESVIGGPLIRSRGLPKREYYGLERQLFEKGVSKPDGRVEEKLDRLLNGDRYQRDRMQEVGQLLKEIANGANGYRIKGS